MVNKCVVSGCFSNHPGYNDAAVFSFPEDPDLFARWKKFCCRNNFHPTKYSRICILHFEPHYMKKGDGNNGRWRLIKKSKPVPTIFNVDNRPSSGNDNTIDIDPSTSRGNNHTASSGKSNVSFSSPPPVEIRTPLSVTPVEIRTPLSVTPTVTIPRKSPCKRIFQEDQLEKFRNADMITNFSSIDKSMCPPGFSCNKFDDHIVFYKMEVDEKSIPCVTETIRVDNLLHVQLYYKNLPIPLPQWFRSTSCKLTSKSMLINLSTYIKNQNENSGSILEELRELKFKKAPVYSARVIQYALLLRYTSLQAYKLLQEEFPLPSLSLLEKITKGGIDPVKAAKVLLSKGLISKDIVLIIDEMYLQKCVDFFGGDMVGCDEEGTMYKGIVGFMIVGLFESIPYIIKSLQEVKIEGGWLKEEIVKACYIQSASKCGVWLQKIIQLMCFTALSSVPQKWRILRHDRY